MENTIEIIISGCIDCPFCTESENDFSAGYYCNLDSESRKLEEKNGPITPAWCPVNNTIIIVRF